MIRICFHPESGVPPSMGAYRRWLAFSSLRPYGSVAPGGENPQIWITSISGEPVPGEDPSTPAFWLPYQNIESGNHIPYWAAYEKR